MTAREAALEGAREHGWHVFRLRITHDPHKCGGNCKSIRPVDRWTQTSTNDPEVISAWDWSDVNAYGIDCGKSGLLVVDEDPGSSWPHNGTRVHSTGRGRHHLYSDVLGSRNAAGVAPWGVDVRGAGGMVVGPGSYHPHGVYGVVEDVEPSSDIPADLLEALKTPREEHTDRTLGDISQLEALGDLEGVYVKLSRAVPTTINTKLHEAAFSAAGIYARLGSGEDAGPTSAGAIQDRLLEIVESIPHAFDRDKSEKTIQNGWAWGYDHPMGDRKRDWSSIWEATELLATVQRAAHHRGLPAPSVLASMLAELALRIPNHVVLPAHVGTEQPLNVGFILLGDSAASKTTSARLGRQILGLGEGDPEWYGGLGSGEGLIDAFYRPAMNEDGTMSKSAWQLARSEDRRFMLTIDEAEELARSKETSKVPAYLRTAIGGGGQLSNTNTKRGGNYRNVPEMSYRMVSLIGVHPEQSDIILSDARNGFPQRFCWIATVDPGLPEKVDDLPEWDGDPIGVVMPEFPVEFGEEWWVIQYPDWIRIEVQQRNLDKSLGKIGALEGHLTLVQLKIAFLLAVAHGETEITEQWWKIADHLCQDSIKLQYECQRKLEDVKRETEKRRETRSKEVQEEIEGDRMQKAALKVIEKLQRGEWLKWKEVRPQYGVRSGLETMDIIDAAVELGAEMKEGERGSYLLRWKGTE